MSVIKVGCSIDMMLQHINMTNSRGNSFRASCATIQRRVEPAGVFSRVKGAGGSADKVEQSPQGDPCQRQEERGAPKPELVDAEQGGEPWRRKVAL